MREKEKKIFLLPIKINICILGIEFEKKNSAEKFILNEWFWVGTNFPTKFTDFYSASDCSVVNVAIGNAI